MAVLDQGQRAKWDDTVAAMVSHASHPHIGVYPMYVVYLETRARYTTYLEYIV